MNNPHHVTDWTDCLFRSSRNRSSYILEFLCCLSVYATLPTYCSSHPSHLSTHLSIRYPSVYPSASSRLPACQPGLILPVPYLLHLSNYGTTHYPTNQRHQVKQRKAAQHNPIPLTTSRDRDNRFRAPGDEKNGSGGVPRPLRRAFAYRAAARAV